MTNELKVNAPKKRRKSVSLESRKARGGWLFVLPFVVSFVLIYLPIVINSIKYSFYEIKGATHTPVGWKNYHDALFDNEQFVQKLLEGLKNLALDVPSILIFSLFMAVLLNQKMAGRAAFRAIFFIPVIISTGVIGDMLNATDVMNESGSINDGSGSSASSGILNMMDMQKYAGFLGEDILKIIMDLMNSIFDIVNRSGVQMLIFLAGLQSISPAIYESVQIDGATAWETFWKITFPMITPMILVNAVYTIIDSFTASSNIVMSFINGLTETNTSGTASASLATAMSWIYFLIVILIVAAVFGIISAFVFYQRRD